MTDHDGKKYPECIPSPLCKWCDYDTDCGKIMQVGSTKSMYGEDEK